MIRFYTFIFAFIACLSALRAQIVTINELMSSNASYLDGFGESSDWFELYHNGDVKTDLTGWGLSDTKNSDEIWTIQNVDLSPGEFLIFRASGKDINQAIKYNTIIKSGDVWKYHIPNQNTSDLWNNPSYDDNGWDTGPTGIGYGDGDDESIITSGTRSVLLRKKFTLNEPELVKELLLHVDYDDAFVAYLNGEEIARANIGTAGQPVAYSATPWSDHEAVMYTGKSPDLFDITSYSDLLVTGENLLAIQVHNISTSSSDMSIIPFLTIGYNKGEFPDPPDILQLKNKSLHTDFKLSSGGETLYLFSNAGNIVDSISFPPLVPDISYGRETEESSNWLKYSTPTPGSKNGGEIYTGGFQDSLTFTDPSGFYNSPVFLGISGADTIFYTLDASDPDENAAMYNGSIYLDNTTLVKARVFKNNSLGRIYNTNILFSSGHSLPVVSLHTEEKYLWDQDMGMYVLGDSYETNFPYFGANFWEDWEYPFHLTYFNENKESMFDTGIGAKIFGGYTRALDQKSFSLFARSQYGDSSFEYPFFTSRKYSSFESLILRNGGNDWDWSFIRDVVMTSLMEGTEIDFQAYQPVVTYLNGDYWGVYNLREKINEHFIASLHDLDASSIDLLESNAVVKHGDNAEFLALRSFIQGKSLANHGNYLYVTSKIDEINFIQYNVAQIYYNNTDWPGNNIRYWKSPGGKWRWILFDTDFGLNLYDINGYKNNTLAFALSPNGPEWPNPPWSTLFLRKMVENPHFKRKFVNYFADFMNEVFLPEYTLAYVDAVVASYKGELVKHRDRWNLDDGFWEDNLNRISLFFNNRAVHMRDHIKSVFDLPATRRVNLKVAVPNTGSIQLNSLHIQVSDWNGFYFEDNPITLKAIAQPGYTFERWSGDISSTLDSLEVNPDKNLGIIAHFTTTSALEQPVVINEINYNSADTLDSDDWVELHNFSDQTIDISGWIFKDAQDNNLFMLPENTTIAAWEYLVLARNKEAFSFHYPDISALIGNFDFGLSKDGDAVRLYNEEGVIMDSVAYLSREPWPVEANGEGPTLELISPDLDNALPQSWASYSGYGSPGLPNQSDPGENPGDVLIYPNPGSDHISVTLAEKDVFIRSVRVYNTEGKFLFEKSFTEDVFKNNVEINHLERGIYLAIFSLSDDRFLGKYFEKF